jgi:hypothetical protein
LLREFFQVLYCCSHQPLWFDSRVFLNPFKHLFGSGDF